MISPSQKSISFRGVVGRGSGDTGDQSGIQGGSTLGTNKIIWYTRWVLLETCTWEL